jgi:hypothetical protein
LFVCFRAGERRHSQFWGEREPAKESGGNPGEAFFFCFFAGGDGGASFARQKKSGFPRGTEDRLCGILVGIFILFFSPLL